MYRCEWVYVRIVWEEKPLDGGRWKPNPDPTRRRSRRKAQESCSCSNLRC